MSRIKRTALNRLVNDYPIYEQATPLGYGEALAAALRVQDAVSGDEDFKEWMEIEFERCTANGQYQLVQYLQHVLDEAAAFDALVEDDKE